MNFENYLYKKVLPIIQKDEGAKALFDWYKENGLKNIGFEDSTMTTIKICNISVKGRRDIMHCYK